MDIITSKLNNGVSVLAKFSKELGRNFPMTFANRTQAERRAEQIPGAFVRQFLGRPFFVVLPDFVPGDDGDTRTEGCPRNLKNADLCPCPDCN